MHSLLSYISIISGHSQLVSFPTRLGRVIKVVDKDKIPVRGHGLGFSALAHLVCGGRGEQTELSLSLSLLDRQTCSEQDKPKASL